VQAAEQYWGAARDVTSSLSHLLRLVPHTDQGHAVWMMAEAKPGQPQPMPAMAQWTSGLKPLTDSAADAVNLLLQVLPSAAASTTAPDQGATSPDAT
jgi:hypothetical protein